MKKKIPTFSSDAEAEQFVDAADLSEYDLSGFKKARFNREAEVARLSMNVPQPLLDAVKKRAKARGIPYTRYVRELLEREISRS